MSTPPLSAPSPGSDAGQPAVTPAVDDDDQSNRKAPRQRSLTPHDELFRELIGTPVNAASQLRGILPPALVARLDLDRLTSAAATLVSSMLGIRYADLLFTAPLDSDEREAFAYVLMEHQSSTDAWMAWRTDLYTAMIWEKHRRDNPDAERLPLVIPVVVHHSRQAWSVPIDVADLLDLGSRGAAGFEHIQPRFGFVLDDLAAVSEQALRERDLTVQARMALVLLKIVSGSKTVAADLAPWKDDLREVLAESRAAFNALVRYIERVTHGRDKVQHEELSDLFAKISPEAEEAYMTIADMLHAEGKAEGKAEGLAEGKAEGLAEGRADTLVEQLTIKFGPLPEDVLRTVRGGTRAQLSAWTARILTADSLDETLRLTLRPDF